MHEILLQLVIEFIGGLNVQEIRERRSSHPRNCVVHLAENGVRKFFSRSPESLISLSVELSKNYRV
jgi:hypothetical protein